MPSGATARREGERVGAGETRHQQCSLSRVGRSASRRVTHDERRIAGASIPRNFGQLEERCRYRDGSNVRSIVMSPVSNQMSSAGRRLPCVAAPTVTDGREISRSTLLRKGESAIAVDFIATDRPEQIYPTANRLRSFVPSNRPSIAMLAFIRKDS